MTTHYRCLAFVLQGAQSRFGRFIVAAVILLACATPSWALEISPSALNFSATAGGADPATQDVVLWNNRSKERSWIATSNASWITITPSTGTIKTEKDVVTIKATAFGLAAGSYSANVTITETSFGSRTRRTTLPVTLSISGTSASPTIQISPGSLSFAGTAGGSNPAAKSFGVSNTGGGTLTWSASENASWLTLSPASGSGNSTVTASVNTANLTAGTFNATITVAATGATPQAIPVALTVTQPTSTTGFTVSPSSLTYTGTVGGPNQMLGVTLTNTGTSTLTVTWTDPINWLVATSGDTVTMLPGASATISHTASTAGLTAGTYSGTATISGGGITKQVPITLNVTSGSATPAIGLSPTSLAFSGSVGGTNPTAKALSIANTGSGTLTWTAGDDAAWLTLTPTSGSNAGTMTANVNTAGLTVGTYNAAITVSATGATAKTIPVTLTLTATGTGSATLTWNANTEPDLAGYKIYVGTQSGIYGAPISVGKVTSYVVTSLAGSTTYFFTITACDSAGNESTHAAEVSKSIF